MNWPLLLIVLALLVLLVVGYLAVVPPHIGAVASRPNPAASYADALQRVETLQAQEATGHNPLCTTQLLTHGQKAARAIAFIHGYTNCPRQFLKLGQQFFDLGYNVLIVRMPHHGLADRMTNDLTHFTADKMMAYADQVLDIAHGLGERVTLVGLSAGGVVAAWAAQQRADLDQAVLIAPGLGLKLIPAPATVLVANVVLRAPDIFSWWDPINKDVGGLPNAYPRFSAHGLAQQLRLSFAVRTLAKRTAPAARSILLITNANDEAVDNNAAAGVAADWRAHGANVRTYEFPAALRFKHDLVDPGQPYQHVDVVYPKIIELINVP
jgi:pimeloyl-ACP methyl ester carboxylesterase